MKTSLCVLLCLSMALNAFAFDYGKRDVAAVDVSMVALLSNPVKYDGKVVRVVGVLLCEFEGSYVFLTRDHYSAHDVTSALAVPYKAKLLPIDTVTLAKENGAIIAVEGRFNKDGEEGGPSLICPVTRVYSR